ncbi:MAG: universal stress protein [Flavobacteriaceae bacterium]
MKNILVPIGTSSKSHETLQYAVDLAKELGAGVYVMDVFNVSAGAGNLANIAEKVGENAKERIKSVVALVDSKDLDIKIATYNGNIVDGITQIDRELGIDLIVLAPRSNDIKEELYLGNTTGGIVKKTNIPTLVVPRGIEFSPFHNILMAFKSGILKRRRILNPLMAFKDRFGSKVNLLLVKTPGYTDEDLQIHPALMDISAQLKITENATTYLGVLEHFQSQSPDLLCVFRRKRGFFKKLWEKNTIPKAEFSAKIPVLILSVKKD